LIDKRIILVCILLLPALLSYSRQGKVYGTITSDDGKPVASCVIKMVNADYVTSSNERGEFSLTYNPDSSHSLVFLCLGYETKEVSIGDDTLRVVLKRKVNKLNDIVVSAGSNGGGK
jgi:hypothetical protein